MADDKVIIVDETIDEEQELTLEEIEEIQRKERLKKLFKKRNQKDTSFLYYLSKVVNVLGLFGIMLGMLLESGGIFAVCLIAMFISSVVNYILFR